VSGVTIFSLDMPFAWFGFDTPSALNPTDTALHFIPSLLNRRYGLLD
jgi:hypothetical protein